jgi:hypothetical protein
MHFKGNPLEVFHLLQKTPVHQVEGVTTLYCEDVFVQQAFYQIWIDGFSSQYQGFTKKIFLTNELQHLESSAFNEENLSLFPERSRLCVLIDAEQLTNTKKELFLSGTSDYWVMLFQKDKEIRRELMTAFSKQHHIEIHSFPFWESEKLLLFWENYYGVRLPAEAKEVIKMSLNPDSKDYARFLQMAYPLLKNNETYDVHFWQKMVTNSFSQDTNLFQLMQYVLEKRWKDFFVILLSLQEKNQDIQRVFGFLMGQFTKLFSMRELFYQKSKRLGAYDKHFVQATHHWKVDEMRRFMAVLGEWQLMSRRQDPLMWQKIKLSLLRQ